MAPLNKSRHYSFICAFYASHYKYVFYGSAYFFIDYMYEQNISNIRKIDTAIVALNALTRTHRIFSRPLVSHKSLSLLASDKILQRNHVISIMAVYPAPAKVSIWLFGLINQFENIIIGLSQVYLVQCRSGFSYFQTHEI